MNESFCTKNLNYIEGLENATENGSERIGERGRT
jgi:hypothetical protein